MDDPTKVVTNNLAPIEPTNGVIEDNTIQTAPVPESTSKEVPVDFPDNGPDGQPPPPHSVRAWPQAPVQTDGPSPIADASPVSEENQNIVNDVAPVVERSFDVRDGAKEITPEFINAGVDTPVEVGLAGVGSTSPTTEVAHEHMTTDSNQEASLSEEPVIDATPRAVPTTQSPEVVAAEELPVQKSELPGSQVTNPTAAHIDLAHEVDTIPHLLKGMDLYGAGQVDEEIRKLRSQHKEGDGG